MADCESATNWSTFAANVFAVWTSTTPSERWSSRRESSTSSSPETLMSTTKTKKKKPKNNNKHNNNNYNINNNAQKLQILNIQKQQHRISNNQNSSKVRTGEVRKRKIEILTKRFRFSANNAFAMSTVGSLKSFTISDRHRPLSVITRPGATTDRTTTATVRKSLRNLTSVELTSAARRRRVLRWRSIEKIFSWDRIRQWLHRYIMEVCRLFMKQGKTFIS